MEQYAIRGGSPARGTVRVQGAKNCALPVVAACLLIPAPVNLTRVPRVKDVLTMLRLVEMLGAKVVWEGDEEVTVDCSMVNTTEAPYELVSTMRASVYVLGPLLARFGRARAALPGGCAFGPRPINYHIAGLRALGAEIELEGGDVVASTASLLGGRVQFDRKSVGATLQVAMAASLAKGETRILNAAQEPDVSATLDFLMRAGAQVEGAGTDSVTIRGVDELSSPGEFEIAGDRIEAGTIAVIAAATGGDVKIEGINTSHMGATVDKLVQVGGAVTDGGRWLRVSGEGRPRPTEITTSPFPGFATDMQPQFTALLSVAHGSSVVRDTIYTDRFKHCYELARMGADIRVEGEAAHIRGVASLHGARVMASDIRAAASLVTAGLMAEGRTTVRRVYHLDRGHYRLEERLSALGLSVRREEE